MQLSDEQMTVVIDAAEVTVRQSFAAELEVFESVTADWRQDSSNGRSRFGGRRRHRGMPGSGIGFGVDATLMTELVLQAGSQALSEVIVSSAKIARSRWSRRPIEKTPQPPLTDGQARALRIACRRHGSALGLSENVSEMLADALVGATSVPARRR